MLKPKQLAEHRAAKLAVDEHVVCGQRVGDVADERRARPPVLRGLRRRSAPAARALTVRLSAISRDAHSGIESARRHLLAHPGQLEVGVRVDEARQDDDVAEVDDVDRIAGPSRHSEDRLPPTPTTTPSLGQRPSRRAAAAARSAGSSERDRVADHRSRAAGLASRPAACALCLRREAAERVPRRLHLPTAPARLLLDGAPRRIAADLRRTRRVAVGARDGELQHARHAALAEDRIAQHLVVHVAALGDEAGVLDVADDLDLVHAVARAGGAHDVLLDHDAAHVVGAVGEAQLPDLAALRHPRRLQVVEVVEHEPRDRERPQVVDAGRFGCRQARCDRAGSSR